MFVKMKKHHQIIINNVLMVMVVIHLIMIQIQIGVLDIDDMKEMNINKIVLTTMNRMIIY